MTYLGWSMKDYDTFLSLKTKANQWNLEEARRILGVEIERRAQRSIIESYEGGVQ